MSKSYFVFDSSALVFRYIRATDPEAKTIQNRLINLFIACAKNPTLIDFQIPNICMAECGRVFAKACFEEYLYGRDDKARQAYKKLRNNLLKDVREDRIIHSYELTRDHFENLEEIFLDDYSLKPPKKRKYMLSSNDALIISMATWIANQWTDDLSRVTIVTAEERMTYVCRSFPNKYARAVNIRKEDLNP